MAIRRIMGFDILKPSPVLSTNEYVGMPADSASIAPYATYYGQPIAIGRVDMTPGVTGLPEHKFGSGPTSRNGMVWYNRYASGSASTTFTRWPLPTHDFVRTSEDQIFGIGFTLKFLKLFTTGSTQDLLVYGQRTEANISTSPTANLLRLASNQTLLVGSSNTPVPVSLNQEYWIEIILRYGTTNSVELWMDGTLMASNASPTSLSAGQILGIGLTTAFNGSTNAARLTQWMIGDIVLWDNTGDVHNGANGPIGPQMILPFHANQVVENNWTPSEGEDPLDLLNGENRDDVGKYITSPAADLPFHVTADLPITNATVVNAIELWGNAWRDTGAPRSINATVLNGENDAIPSETTSLTENPRYVRLAKLLPATEAELEVLDSYHTSTLDISVNAPA